MQYLAALDYEHLDNGVFLTTLAKSLSQQQEKEDIRSIIVHADSEYTERVIQTGVMRDDARIRTVKDLNKRLVALFADQGVSAVGINPNKRDFITLNNNSLQLDHSFLDSLPKKSVLLLSTMVQDKESEEPVVIELPQLISFLFEELDADELFIFSKSDEAEVFTNAEQPESLQWNSMNSDFREEQIPDEFSDLNTPARITTARDFNQLPDLNHSIFIHSASK